jgi:hypothetical protein
MEDDAVVPCGRCKFCRPGKYVGRLAKGGTKEIPGLMAVIEYVESLLVNSESFEEEVLAGRYRNDLGMVLVQLRALEGEDESQRPPA